MGWGRGGMGCSVKIFGDVCVVLLFEFIYVLSVLINIVIYLHVTVMLIANFSLACQKF